MSFGTVTFVNVSPILGYMITQRWSAGIGVLVQYVNDKRFLPALERWDYGGSIFTRYAIFQPLFLHAEYEYLNYEFADQRYGYTSVLAGGGISQPIGKKASFNMVALYNFTYDPTENPRPYNSPIVFRVGFTAGF